MIDEKELQNKLWNIEILVTELITIPHTYKTILGKFHNGHTYSTVLRKKLNVLCKDGIINQCIIPGTRHGEKIFYNILKKYHIVVETDRMRNNIYYFFNYEKTGNFYFTLKEYWTLNLHEWICSKNRILFSGKILKWI